MKKNYRVGLIGCGVMAEVHASHIHCLDSVTVAYACDSHLEKAAAFQKKYHIEQITADYLDILRDPTVDIVIIATPPSTHLSIFQDCLRYGKHVLCEKPITNTLADAEAFVRAAKEHPECKVLIGNILRHNKSYQKMAEIIHSGALGKPLVFRMAQNHHTMNWPLYLANLSDSAPLVNCGIHYVDVMEWFSGEKAVQVQAMGCRTEDDVPQDTYNYGIMTIRFDGGSMGYYEAGWANTCSSDNTKEIIGPKGRLKLIYQKDRLYNAEEGDLIEWYKYPEKEYVTINSPCDRKPADDQFLYLIRMIETGCDPVPTLDHVLSCMKTCFEADRQAKQG
ncbi:MAG TPA: Gfo/Idh/MocA family oxidoreductase [Candidatus Gallacutalibacter pullicola]|uniref:Gfo/Idh/MocA family oxidoreductase n=1 Tax=Candidatus Gallacutalibacter pullicola TaxID=2840830 RepID=A0A9D1DQ62_9FIRM|nr:Gfo/Idh/MocA family oxidoreductase [Candidatus Gallacutalibacter pullicola]